MSKEYTEKEAAKILAKSMWKSVKKAIGKNPVQDVLDTNSQAEASPKTIPADKQGVMNKGPAEKEVTPKDKPMPKPVSNPVMHQKPKKKLQGFMENRKSKNKPKL